MCTLGMHCAYLQREGHQTHLGMTAGIVTLHLPLMLTSATGLGMQGVICACIAALFVALCTQRAGWQL